MENDITILSLIDEFADDVRKYCNGISSSNVSFKVFGRDKGDNFDDVFFNIILTTKRYFAKSINNPKTDDLTNINQVIIDLIFDYENKLLVI